MNVGTQQLYDKGDGRRMINEIEQRVLFENAGTQVYMIIFGPTLELRFLKKRIRQSVTCFHETGDRFFIKRPGNHQEAVPIKRLALL
jgi:hypothetical protein